MKKFGFTLAEVLITLGIIGVVAALTTPALVSSVGNAKIGPSLAKAVSTFTTANEMMLSKEEVSTIIPGIMQPGGMNAYHQTLSKYMKISRLNDNPITYRGFNGEVYSPSLVIGNNIRFGVQPFSAFASEDGLIYYIIPVNRITPHQAYADIPSNQLIGDVLIDINGLAGPNRIGKDLFRFLLYNDGSLRPYGAAEFDKHVANNTPLLWNTNNNCNANGVANAETCAGSIFENNMKVIYQ